MESKSKAFFYVVLILLVFISSYSIWFEATSDDGYGKIVATGFIGKITIFHIAIPFVMLSLLSLALNALTIIGCLGVLKTSTRLLNALFILIVSITFGIILFLLIVIKVESLGLGVITFLISNIGSIIGNSIQLNKKQDSN